MDLSVFLNMQQQHTNIRMLIMSPFVSFVQLNRRVCVGVPVFLRSVCVHMHVYICSVCVREHI